MLGRAGKLVGLSPPRVGGTFMRSRATCCAVMARHRLHTNFSILDEADAGDTISWCATRSNCRHRNPLPHEGGLRDMLSKSINGDRRHTIIEREYGHFASTRRRSWRCSTYCRYKYENQLLDYDDLLIHLEMLLEKSPAPAQISARYRYLYGRRVSRHNALQGASRNCRP